MPTVERHSLERRIVEYLQEHYPVTAQMLALSLGLPPKRVIMELRKMESRGMVELDVLPDTVFVRALVTIPLRDGSEGRGKEGEKKETKKEKEGGTDPAYL
jgi:predicted ArsR family transcriptional regulator